VTLSTKTTGSRTRHKFTDSTDTNVTITGIDIPCWDMLIFTLKLMFVVTIALTINGSFAVSIIYLLDKIGIGQ
jgi:hypothetical protein